MEEFKLGDYVSIKGSFKSIFGKEGLDGRVCKIDGDLIWYVQGNCPEELIMNGTLNWEPHNSKYKWKIMNKYKYNLSKSGVPFYSDPELKINNLKLWMKSY